ncbi:hypothetical protein [Rubrobacter indicoceani]|uniref:hypothetical protein n=1 Tax=Rubrobacter indicoceani TaxID=2051957 RepID=UPI000E5ABF93|nr:hypothetical protein [Rubrobacter indicoceani]
MARDKSEAFSWLDAPMSGQPARSSEGREQNAAGNPGGPPSVPGAVRRSTGRRARTKTGKRSDPNYVMSGAYIERGIRERVDTALANLRQPGEKKLEYSDLVQSLLVRWLEEVGEENDPA